MAGIQNASEYDQYVADITKDVLMNLVKSGLVNPQRTRRKQVNWESRLIREYREQAYPYSLHWYRKEMGAIPKEGDPSLLSRTRRWADCVILHEGEVIIVESKMKPSLNAVSQLYGYVRLFPDTPEFFQIRDLPVRGQILVASHDAMVEQLTNEWGLEYVLFQPSFWEDYKKIYITRE